MKLKPILTDPIVLLILVIFGIIPPINIYGETMKSDWPRFRGPNGDGISTETDWDPEAISGRPKVVWKTNIG